MNEQLALIGHSRDGPGFRPIHYLGNKSRVLGAIESAVNDVAGDGRVCDLFAGSGVVAQRLGQNRSVVAADIQEYSRVVTSALLNPARLSPEAWQLMMREARHRELKLREILPPGLFSYEDSAIAAALASDAEPLCDIIEYGSSSAFMGGGTKCPEKLAIFLHQIANEIPKGPNTVLTRYYSGVYYSYQQAIELDALAASIRKLPDDYRDIALAALLSTASELVSTVGNQFAQPVRPRSASNRPKVGTVATIARRRQRSVTSTFRQWLDRYQALSPAKHRHQVLREDFRNVLAALPGDITAIYADPPYTRDHYSRFYHVLETIAVGDEPEISTMTLGQVTQLSRGLYRKDRHQSPFCIKTEVEGTFHHLFSTAVQLKVPIVLSYSPHSPGTAARPNTRLLTVPRLLEIAEEHFRKIHVQSTGRIAHSKLNSEHLNAEITYEAEIIVSAVP